MPSLRMLANSFDSTSRIWCRICTRGRLHLSPLPIQGIHRWGIACSTVNAVGILEEPCLFRSLAMGSSMAQGCTWVASTRHPLSKPEHEVCTFPSPRLFVWLEHVLMSVFRGSSTFVFHSSSLGRATRETTFSRTPDPSFPSSPHLRTRTPDGWETRETSWETSPGEPRTGFEENPNWILPCFSLERWRTTTRTVENHNWDDTNEPNTTDETTPTEVERQKTRGKTKRTNQGRTGVA